MLESELRKPVEDWLVKYGYTVAHECMVGGYCDLIGSKWGKRVGKRRPKLNEVMAVELKLRDIKGVIEQAKSNHRHVNKSFAAMPLDFCRRMRMSSRDKFDEAGIGLIGIDVKSGEIVVFHCSEEKTDRDYNSGLRTFIKDRLWSFNLRHKAKEPSK